MMFSEVRLQSSAVCRAWTSDHGCFSATEWEVALGSLPLPRFLFEQARLRISEALSVDGIDPLGIGRALLIHESAASLSRAGLREIGFVHLEAASGIHLYALCGAYEFALARIANRAGWGLRWTEFLRAAVPLLLWAAVFGLVGFRPGLLRPLVLVGARWLSTRFGFRWARVTPIFLALLFDALCGFFFSFGTEHAFADWAPGELHYAAAWWGGILGFDWARARGYGTFRAHLALSVASWIAVLPLDLAAGRFAPATPLLSLLTVEVLVRGGYLALFAGAAFVGFGGLPFAREGLEWAVFFLNRGVGELFTWLTENGLLRRIPEGCGFPLAAITGAWVAGLALSTYTLKKQSFGGYGASS